MPNPYLILGTAGAWLVSLVVCGWLLYARGHDDMRNYYTGRQLAQAIDTIKQTKQNQTIAADAGAQHEAKVQVVHDRTDTIYRTVNLPPDADPFLPVGFVRLFDRAASRSIDADPYPGKSDGDPSDVRVSEAQSLLVKDWADKYYACRQQVADTASLNPVLPPPPEKPSLIERIFQ